MNTTTMPAIGTRIRPLFVPGVTDSPGLYPWLSAVTNAVVTETGYRECEVEPNGTRESRNVVWATFTNPDPHATYNWYVSVWEEYNPTVAVGDKIIARKIPGVTGEAIDEYTNTIGTVTYVNLPGDYVCADFHVKANPTNLSVTEWVKYDESADGHTLTVSETHDEIAGIRIPANCTVDEYRAIIETVANDLAEARRQREATAQDRDRYHTQVMSARDAIQIIGDRLNEEAEERDWCEEFDRIVADVNESLHPLGYELPVREREYTVEITITGTITTTYTHTVTASSPEAAQDIADEDCRYGNLDLDSELTEAARNVSFDDVDWSIDNIQVA